MKRSSIQGWQVLVAAATAALLLLIIVYWEQAPSRLAYLPATQAGTTPTLPPTPTNHAASRQATIKAYEVMSQTLVAKFAPTETALALIPTRTPPPLPPTTTPVFGLIYECTNAESHYVGWISVPDPYLSQYHMMNCWRGYVNGTLLTIAGGDVPTSTEPTAYVPQPDFPQDNNIAQGVLLVFRGVDIAPDSLMGIYPAPYRAGVLSIRAVNGSRMVVDPLLTGEKEWTLPAAYVFDLNTFQYVTPTPSELPDFEAGAWAEAQREMERRATFAAMDTATQAVIALTPPYTPTPPRPTNTPLPTDTPAPTPTVALGETNCPEPFNSYTVQPNSCWWWKIDGRLALIIAGFYYDQTNSQHYVLTLIDKPPYYIPLHYGSIEEINDPIFELPKQVGAIRIVSIIQSRVTLAPYDKTVTPKTFIFDLITRDFISP